MQVVTNAASISGALNATLPVNVSCPAGKLALGGGGSVTNATAGENVSLNQSNPSGTPPTGWHVQAEQGSVGTQSWTLTAYVVCTV